MALSTQFDKSAKINMVASMTADDVRELLRRSCHDAGSASAWAKANGVSPAYVSDALNKQREPGPAICEALGVEREVRYRKRQTA